jgi:hypothetical protein
MKTVKPLLCIFFLLIFTSTFSNSNSLQTYKDNQGELVIHFDGLSSKDVSQIQTLINGINGLTFNSYCAKLDVYLVTYDNTIFSTDEFALKAITNLSDNLRPVLMRDATHESLISHCH